MFHSRAGTPAAAATLLAAALGLSACAPATLERVVLLPQDDPSSSAVEVRTAQSALVLDRPYQVAVLRADLALLQETTTAEEVARAYPELLQLQAPPQARFSLNFLPGSSQLTPESQAQLSQVLEAARQRAGGEIVVVGHTDRQGAADANDRLSLARAQAIKELLVQQGFDAELIEAVGRGEREPLIPTEDEVVEPRNRRAEIVVR
ncbi:MAG TPA: OmpA family protein [Hydrogenophaga sp.]|uniref:OmpA family protein n=1 Tax=Hydrogenophaga sp. TaxID=1904254 RepID=UPI002B712473|nr:OmpA family protein [Hydrogenophaga sp.]HMN93794.1 OmpA family protein [Hydrogenophaga sp.]HMP09683.1 OmpA family protein [Hydrogenophaga sp.]